MRKIAALLLLTTLLFPALAAGNYSQTGAVGYLTSQPASAWTTLALAAAGAAQIPTEHLKTVQGGSAINYAAPILALAAANLDPRTYGSEDFVAKLKSFHVQNQLGDPATLNDDIFGVLALVSSGSPLSDTIVQDGKRSIIANQAANGGFPFAVGGSPDTNMTATAILALLAAGEAATSENITKAIGYLRDAQNEDGGFPYDPASPYSTASDSSSTAWVIWALNALSIDPATWAASSGNPISYLRALQNDSGYFGYQSASETANGFSPVTTAYAVIALSGKKLPVKIYDGGAQVHRFRIEGGQREICSGSTVGPTALDIVKNASAICGFAYNISNTQYGPYLDRIADDSAVGLKGWMFFVNNLSPDMGAADTRLQNGDEVLWYYGDWGWKPLKLELAVPEISSGGGVLVTVKAYDNGFAPLPGATITYGNSTAITNSSGEAVIYPADGYYKITAGKSGHVRSNTELLKVGSPGSASVSLGANILQGAVAGEDDEQEDSVGFTVDPGAVSFGTLHPGSKTTKNITLKSRGTAPQVIESAVNGDALFRDNLLLGGRAWRSFSTELSAGADFAITLSLSVPTGYPGSGSKTGTITFWAQAR